MDDVAWLDFYQKGNLSYLDKLLLKKYQRDLRNLQYVALARTGPHEVEKGQENEKIGNQSENVEIQTIKDPPLPNIPTGAPPRIPSITGSR